MKDRQAIVHALNRALMQVVQQHGTLRMEGLEIIIEIFHHTYNPEIFDSAIHHHPFYELSLMTHGSTAYYIGDAVSTISAERGDMIMIPPYIEHRRLTVLAPANIFGFQMQINVVDPALKPALRQLPSELVRRAYLFDAVPETRRFLRQLYRELLRPKPFWQMRAALLIHEFLVRFFRAGLSRFGVGSKSDYSGQSHQEYLVLLADRYLEENIGRPVQLDDLAKHCGMSKRHLNRIYTATRGVSLGRSIIAGKIDYARRLLMRNDRLIKDIAVDLGFSSVSYFCRQFRQVTGMTPDLYRSKR